MEMLKISCRGSLSPKLIQNCFQNPKLNQFISCVIFQLVAHQYAKDQRPLLDYYDVLYNDQISARALVGQSAMVYLGSISAALSCPIYVPPRKETAGRVSGKPCL